MGGGPGDRGAGTETSLSQNVGGQGRGIANVRKTVEKWGGGGGGRTSGSPVWAGRSSSGSREPPKRCRGEVQVPVLDQETEAGPWGGVRRAACGAVSGQRRVYVPYSAREGPEPEWASQKGQRMATLSKQGRKVGRFWRGSAVLRCCGACFPKHALVATVYEGLACIHSRTKRTSLWARADSIGDWRDPVWSRTISSIKFILRGQYKRRDGRSSWGSEVGGRRREERVGRVVFWWCARVCLAAGFSGSELLEKGLIRAPS